MMKKLISWIKENKLVALLLVLVAYLFYQSFFSSPFWRFGLKRRFQKETVPLRRVVSNRPKTLVGEGWSQPEFPPTPEKKERLVIKESWLSLLVKDVSQAQKIISQKVKEWGGYMVNSRLEKPQEAATGAITVRVPQKRLTEALDYFRSLAVKVVSENLVGRDVTDEYVDLEARLATLQKTKTKFEEILTKAEKVQDILEVQRELINLQEQIDRLKGRQNYFQKSAVLSKITVYLATDEWSLPYAPQDGWRPKVIFKQAVRSLVRTIRRVGTIIIWLGVYAPLWLPLVVVWIIKKRRSS